MKIKLLILIKSTLFAFLILGSPNAEAHAQLISTNPLPNSTLAQIPEEITLEFGEEMLDFEDGNLITVIGPNGDEVSINKTSLSGSIISRKLSKEGIPGLYKVNFRAISGDGHKVTGNFIFKVNAQETHKATSVPKSLLSSNEEVAESNLPEAKAAEANSSHNPISHFVGVHSFHILLTLIAFLLIMFWHLYRQRSQ
jgi:methionine-rich copper-binding protein CopC